MVSNIKRVIEFQYPTALPADWRALDLSDGTGAHLTFWNVAKLGTQPTQLQLESIEQSQAYIDYWAAPAVTARARQAVADTLTNLHTDELERLRALISAAVDSDNVLRKRDRDRAADVAASTSFADLKTRWAARSSLDDITMSDVKTSMTNHLNAGDDD